MRFRLTVGAAGCALAAAGAAPGLAAATRATTAVGVGEREYRVAVYRPVVAPGRVRFNITNRGEDAHNLDVLGPNGRSVAASPDIEPGARFTLRARLARPGVYTLVCTKADHAALGMIARLRVKAPPRHRPNHR